MFVLLEKTSVTWYNQINKNEGNKDMKKHLWLRIIITVAVALILVTAGLVVYLTVSEYRPADMQDADHWERIEGETVSLGEQMTLYSWNIGYAGLGAGTDFFMDGGDNVNPTDDEVTANLAAICDFISSNSADVWMLQEVDVNSSRTDGTNELFAVSQAYSGSAALAYNYKCGFVPYPLPPIGRVASGVATLTGMEVIGTPQRVALPCPFSWPVSTANLKRCLLITRLQTDASDHEVVIVNLHLEAYDDGEGKISQTKQLMELLQTEYEKGNYVIAGGDFNRAFPGTWDIYPVVGDVWMPGSLDAGDLPEGFGYAFDSTVATCRLLDRPLDEDSQKYVLDGFIVSPNVKVELVETIDLGFKNSDHNPVKLTVTLLP